MTLNDFKTQIDRGATVSRFDAAAQSSASVTRRGSRYVVDIDGQACEWKSWEQVEADLGAWTYYESWQVCAGVRG
jgi:hypothetical protein